MKTPFIGTSYSSRSKWMAYSQLINLYVEVAETKEGKDIGAMVGCPGLLKLGTIGSGPIRAIRACFGFLWVISGAQMYKVDPATWSGTLLGAVAAGTDLMSSVNNPTQVAFSDDTTLYVYDASSSTFSTPASYPVGGDILAYQDGYAVTNVKGTQQWYQSNLNDLTTWGGLAFSSQSSQPEDVYSLADLHREVWIISQKNAGIWINAGLPNFVFEQLAGANPEVGTIAPYSVAKVGETLMWLGNNQEGGISVYQTKGYGVGRRSTHALETQWGQYSTVADAFAFSYQQEGHLFYVITFPTGGETWVYDATVSEILGKVVWHQRAYWNTVSGAYERYRANCHAFINNTHVVGDYQNGNIYSLDMGTYQDNGNTRKWTRTWRAMPEGKQSYDPLSFDSLQIDMQTGLNISAGADPQVMLRWSNDGGNNWSSIMTQSVGQSGETTKRVMFRRLGSTSPDKGLDRVFELSGTDMFPVVLVAANLEGG